MNYIFNLKVKFMKSYIKSMWFKGEWGNGEIYQLLRGNDKYFSLNNLSINDTFYDLFIGLNSCI